MVKLQLAIAHQPNLTCAMRIQDLLPLLLLLTCIEVIPAFGLVALRGQSPGQRFVSETSRHKRQPSEPQEQGSLNLVAAPGQQTQDITNTTAVGDVAGTISNSPVTNIEVDCWNITTGRDNKCWEVLDLTAWLEDWLKRNPCHPNEAFASCFLRIQGFPGLDCTGIKIDACTAPQGDNLLKEPEVFYVAYNIYGTILLLIPIDL